MADNDSISNLDERRREQLALWRRRAGHSQDGLAEAMGVSRSSIYRWESGRVVPTPRQLRKWAEVLNVDVGELDDLLWSGDRSVRPMEPDESLTSAQGGQHTGQTEADQPLATDRSASAAPEVAADIVDPPGFDGHGENDIDHAVRTVLGLESSLPAGGGVRAAVALSSFSGRSIQGGLEGMQTKNLPPAFVQGEDDIANDLFFGKRDVQLANRVSAALGIVGFEQPIYIEDRAVWDNLRDPSEPLVPRLRLFQDNGGYDLDVLVVVGLWSQLLATGLAGWDGLREFQMVGDPRQHSTRTVRICSKEGLRIVDLNASPESEQHGGNPAIIITRRLTDIHLVVIGGATSLGTLRLAELLGNKGVWLELAYAIETQGDDGKGGTWFAIECPNAAQWRDRCRIVGTGTMMEPLDLSIRDLAHVEWTEEG